MTNIKLMKLHDCCCTSFLLVTLVSGQPNIRHWTRPCLMRIERSTSTSYVDAVTLDSYATVVVLVKERKRKIVKLEEPGIVKR